MSNHGAQWTIENLYSQPAIRKAQRKYQARGFWEKFSSGIVN